MIIVGQDKKSLINFNSKYKNKKVIIDGIEFDSKKERKILSTIKINGKTRANKRH